MRRVLIVTLSPNPITELNLQAFESATEFIRLANPILISLYGSGRPACNAVLIHDNYANRAITSAEYAFGLGIPFLIVSSTPSYMNSVLRKYEGQIVDVAEFKADPQKF